MNAKAFAEAYATLEQDHELVLDRVQALREMVLVLMDPDNLDAPRVFARLRELDNYFSTQLVTHMEEEETTLFPLLESFPPEGPALSNRLGHEHDELRRKLEEFSSCLTIALELQDRPPTTVIEDLLVYTWDLWELLDQHAYEETHGLNECLKRAMKAGKAMPA